MKSTIRKAIILTVQCASFFYIVSCKYAGNNSLSKSRTSFNSISSSQSNLFFANTITENDSLTYFKFPYIYNGGGVATGDINNDGLSDIFLTGNMVPNKLYLNKGDLQFEDISLSAKISGDDRWYTGVTMVDINHDGFLDIYLSVSGLHSTTKNELYINNGNLTFTEQASAYGIADQSNSIQSTFFDYDNDGDLDLFVANYPLIGISLGSMYYRQKMNENRIEESGHLYRNDGNKKFMDVTQEARVMNFGLTLGLIASDFNNDGWVDLYLSNDFNVPDYFYMNNADGTFKEVIQESTGHTSMFGMGIDASDFNNDGLIDLMQVDMTPEDYVRSKVNMSSMNPKAFYQSIEMGFHYQYMQNSLQVNRGVNDSNIPILSEISRMSKMASTDWSWSTLFADLDNDGWKDIYITNGIKRDVNDNDVENRTKPTSFQQAFNVQITDYASQPIANYAYQNQGDFTFKKIGKEWQLDLEGFSNGMSYADLDNDGDLDLVISNLDSEVSLFENETSNANYIQISLNGSEYNLNGLGAKVTVKTESGLQKQEITLTRGFQSSVDPRLHFGIGDANAIESVHVRWLDGKEQLLKNPPINTIVLLEYSQVTTTPYFVENGEEIFEDITNASGIDFHHEEDLFDDYTFEPLLPYQYSKLGPGLAKGDINNDGLDDFYIGNASGKAGALYVQSGDANFKEVEGPWSGDKSKEDAGAVFFDFDNDGDQDLYVASHGNQYQDYTDRLYINTPNGFVKSINSLPKKSVANQSIALADFDQDGRIDIFLGGRNTPGKYPFPANSFLLRNVGGTDQALKFENVTVAYANDLNNIGMVTDAEWSDLDGDGWPELIISGEWMPITIFKNDKGKLLEQTEEYGLSKLKGWWYSVKSVDVDNDGDLDLIAGNLGLNHKYQASEDAPFHVYASDFDENGTNDIVLSYDKGEKKLPLRGRECSSQQVPAIAKRFETYRSFAGADLEEIYGSYMLENALHYEANTFGHYWFENENGRYTKHHLLPTQAQFSSINAIESFDYNGDEYPDFFLAGNLYVAEVETPRSDAGLGLVLVGSSKGFTPVPSNENGLLFRGDIKSVEKLRLANGNTGFLLAMNSDSLKLIQFNPEPIKEDQLGSRITASAE